MCDTTANVMALMEVSPFEQIYDDWKAGRTIVTTIEAKTEQYSPEVAELMVADDLVAAASDDALDGVQRG